MPGQTVQGSPGSLSLCFGAVRWRCFAGEDRLRAKRCHLGDFRAGDIDFEGGAAGDDSQADKVHGLGVLTRDRLDQSHVGCCEFERTQYVQVLWSNTFPGEANPKLL